MLHVVISDKKLWPQDTTTDGFQAEVLSRSDYYPFGMQIENRTFGDSTVSRGFQGMEKDNAISGFGNHYTTFNRPYDPRLGRWWKRDPLAREFPWQSSYVGMDNNPIFLSDPFGDSTETAKRDFSDAVRISLISFNIKADEKINQAKRFISDLIFGDHDQGEPIRDGGGGINLVTFKELVPGNQSNLKGTTNEGVRNVSMDEMEGVRSVASTTGFFQQLMDVSISSFSLGTTIGDGINSLLNIPKDQKDLQVGDTGRFRVTPHGGQSFNVAVTRNEDNTLETINGLSQDEIEKFELFK